MTDSSTMQPPFDDLCYDDRIEASARRVADATRVYHTRVHEELLQLRHFKNWAMKQFSANTLQTIEDLRAEVMKLRVEVTELRDSKAWTERKLDEVEICMERLGVRYPSASPTNEERSCRLKRKIAFQSTPVSTTKEDNTRCFKNELQSDDDTVSPKRQRVFQLDDDA